MIEQQKKEPVFLWSEKCTFLRDLRDRAEPMFLGSKSVNKNI